MMKLCGSNVHTLVNNWVHIERDSPRAVCCCCLCFQFSSSSNHKIVISLVNSFMTFAVFWSTLRLEATRESLSSSVWGTNDKSFYSTLKRVFLMIERLLVSTAQLFTPKYQISRWNYKLWCEHPKGSPSFSRNDVVQVHVNEQ